MFATHFGEIHGRRITILHKTIQFNLVMGAKCETSLLLIRPFGTCSFVLLVSLLQSHVGMLICFVFNKRYFSVVFTPVVNKKIRSHDPMALAHIQTMMEVISTRFSNVYTTESVWSRNGDDFYLRNYTYYRGVLASVYNGEAAALLNKKRNATLIKMIIGVTHFDSAAQFKTALHLALESAEKANIIYPGTVTGVSLNNGRYEYKAQRNLEYLKELKNNASHLGIQLRVAVYCSDFLQPLNNSTFQIHREIVIHADFIICTTILAKSTTDRGPEYCLNQLSVGFLKAEASIKRINSKTYLIAMTAWADSDMEQRESVETQKVFWEMASTWAAEHNIMVVMESAFDGQSGRCGWWRLSNLSRQDSVDVYTEKISILANHGFATDEMSTLENVNASNAFSYTTEPTPVTHSSISSTSLVGTLVGTGVVVILVATTAATLLIVRFRRMKKREIFTGLELYEFFHGTCNFNAHGDVSRMPEQNVMSTAYKSSYEFSLDMLHIDKGTLLGAGEFGCVYKAKIIRGDGEVEVALKMTRRGASDSTIKNLLSEIKILNYLATHVNIVALKGAYTAELSRGLVYLATELCSLGSLEGFLRNGHASSDNQNITRHSDCDYVESINTGVKITLCDMIQWSHGIACGMEYVAEKFVVHADLATRNVLLASDKVAKITDFGLSRRMYNYRNYVKTGEDHLPWRWMAIESLKRLEFSTHSDVWGYGVTLWEIFSMGDTPYPGMTCTAVFVNNLVKGCRLECPKYASEEIFTIMTQCWHIDPMERPTFQRLREQTARLLTNELAASQQEINI